LIVSFAIFSDEEVERMFQLSKQFFSLPTEVKAKIAWNTTNRGWVSFQREALDPVNNPNGDPKDNNSLHSHMHGRTRPDIQTENAN
jgi:isopenicillin N synthase-like dioxygenase